MSQQTPKQARIIDPILTTHAQGYVRPGNVGKFLFPTAEVNSLGGQVITFGKEGFKRYATKRAPGAATQRVQFGHAGEKYSIIPAALEALVPDELQNEAQQVPGIDLASDSVDLVLDVFELEHECECADLARDASRYDANHKLQLTSTTRWSADTSTPTSDVFAGSEAIRSTIGMRANVGILSPSSFTALQTNKDILDRLKYTSRDSVTTDMLARLWNLQNVYVGDALVANDQDDFSDVWGDDVILAYVAPPTGGNRRSAARPSYGYTYTMRGNPHVKQPYYENNRASWIYGVQADRTPVLSGISGGFLLQGAGAR
ncbi:hypothetical protein RDV84_00195 [Lysobacter yananisis]|uniref:Phage capsid protein n=1 Tax=Lysobacter yananisis TaxID=1003114 RepID=A0ABY9PB99_9GAMM|nr:hypothetical protein [Lysobacter yananisis]WMT03310.1 hypothetical protein RDV84_00195 [Lysobacter yananisis]